MNPDLTYLYNITKIAQDELKQMHNYIKKKSKKNKTLKKRKISNNKTKKMRNN
tara:strand:- start:3548 stop:3706 length:159 start_codon:yes stop_codon:yes gene_type:complete